MTHDEAFVAASANTHGALRPMGPFASRKRARCRWQGGCGFRQAGTGLLLATGYAEVSRKEEVQERRYKSVDLGLVRGRGRVEARLEGLRLTEILGREKISVDSPPSLGAGLLLSPRVDGVGEGPLGQARLAARRTLGTLVRLTVVVVYLLDQPCFTASGGPKEVLSAPGHTMSSTRARAVSVYMESSGDPASERTENDGTLAAIAVVAADREKRYFREIVGRMSHCAFSGLSWWWAGVIPPRVLASIARRANEDLADRPVASTGQRRRALALRPPDLLAVVEQLVTAPIWQGSEAPVVGFSRFSCIGSSSR